LHAADQSGGGPNAAPSSIVVTSASGRYLRLVIKLVEVLLHRSEQLGHPRQSLLPRHVRDPRLSEPLEWLILTATRTSETLLAD
jgi:hypothetical protein